VSTIQRRYDLTSTESGLIVSVFDMAVIASVIFVSYFGGKGHKPRWLGIGLLVQGLGKKYNSLYFILQLLLVIELVHLRNSYPIPDSHPISLVYHSVHQYFISQCLVTLKC